MKQDVPMPVTIAVLVVAALLIVGIGYWLSTRGAGLRNGGVGAEGGAAPMRKGPNGAPGRPSPGIPPTK